MGRGGGRAWGERGGDGGEEPYAAGGREGVVDVEEADGVFEGAGLERRDGADGFCHDGRLKDPFGLRSIGKIMGTRWGEGGWGSKSG